MIPMQNLASNQESYNGRNLQHWSPALLKRGKRHDPRTHSLLIEQINQSANCETEFGDRERANFSAENIPLPRVSEDNEPVTLDR